MDHNGRIYEGIDTRCMPSYGGNAFDEMENPDEKENVLDTNSVSVRLPLVGR